MNGPGPSSSSRPSWSRRSSDFRSGSRPLDGTHANTQQHGLSAYEPGLRRPPPRRQHSDMDLHSLRDELHEFMEGSIRSSNIPHLDLMPMLAPTRSTAPPSSHVYRGPTNASEQQHQQYRTSELSDAPPRLPPRPSYIVAPSDVRGLFSGGMEPRMTEPTTSPRRPPSLE